MRRRSVVTAFAGFAAGCASAPPPQQAVQPDPVDEQAFVIDDTVWLPGEHRIAGGRMRYRLHAPGGVPPEAPAPLVIFLHGSGERGDDNRLQLLHGARDIYAYTQKKRLAAFILAPQAPYETAWANVPHDPPIAPLPAEDSPNERLMLDLMRLLMGHYPIDPTRIYLTGLSMGGFGVFDLAARHPDVFAAALPLCGGGDPAAAPALAQTPLWAFHGARDDAVNVAGSRDMVAALRAINARVRYTEYPELGHLIWDETYRNDAVLDWMFAQRRSGQVG